MIEVRHRLKLIILGLFLSIIGCGPAASTPAAAPAGGESMTGPLPSDHAAEQAALKLAVPPQTEPDPGTATESADQAERTDKQSPKLVDLNWEQLQKLVAEHKGKVVVVDVWSTSCEPCLREFPRLVALQKRHQQDVVCISFDCDFIGARNKPVDYYRERVVKALTGMQAGNLINGICTEAADELFQKIDVDSIPAVYVYDRSGKLARRFDNRTPASETEEGISYEKQIDPLVAELVKAEQN